MYRPTVQQKNLRAMIHRYKYVMAFGGSRSGKTFEFCVNLVLMAITYGGRYAIFRKYYNAVKNAVFADTFPKVMATCFPGLRCERNLSESIYRFNTDTGGISTVHFLGLDDKERVEKILGREFAVVYFNECSEISYHAVETTLTRLSQRVINHAGKTMKNRAFFDCNPPSISHWSHRLFIDGVNPSSRLAIPNPDDYGNIRINPLDNLANLPTGYVESLGTLSLAKRKRFLYGEWEDDNENALWKRSTMIDPFRIATNPNRPEEFDRLVESMERIVVGVDPAVTANTSSDSTGIVVCGRRHEEKDGKTHYYILEDATIKASPHEWAKCVVKAFNRYQANCVAVEVNQGGDLVIETLRQIDPSVPVKREHATRGKIVRAEPVAALYEQGLVHHVNDLEELEMELTGYTGDPGDESPDRMDALVWAMKNLSVANTEIQFGNITYA